MSSVTRYIPISVALQTVRDQHIGPVRDVGLLQSAIERPATTVAGNDAYGSLADKAGALLHSLCSNHALVDGNKRIALTLTLAFLSINGHRSSLSHDALFDLVMAVASGGLRDATTIGAALRITPRDSHLGKEALHP